MTTIGTTSGQRTVHLIRHGEKNASTAAVDPNQLTEQGRRGALAYGVALRGSPTLEVYCSTDADGKAVDRSHDTGWYIHAGYAGLEYDAANDLFRSDSSEKQRFVPGLEERLQQRVPDRLVKEYKAGRMTRAQAHEQCYRIVANPRAKDVDVAELRLLLDGTHASFTALRYHLVERKYSQSLTVVLVGHDPNIGCLQQELQPKATIEVLLPLHGIVATREQTTLFPDLPPPNLLANRFRYSFISGGKNYEGALFGDAPSFSQLLT